MIRQMRVITAAVTLLCLGLTLVVIDSLSTGNNIRFQSWKRKTESRLCPSSRSRTDTNRASASCLFSLSDFSSHPYSVYYGTSGSTAQQNFGQNDDINDVYGYGPDARVGEEPYDDRENRQLQSMQDVKILGGRRGAAMFGTKYDEENQHLYGDPRGAEEHERLFHEDRYIEDQHMMDQMASILHEHDDLRRKLETVVSENIDLQNQQNMNGGPQFMPPEQNQYCPQDQSTSSVVDSVMEQLKNMQRTVQAVEAEQQRRNTNGCENLINSPTTISEAPTVESIKSELRNMEQVLQTFGSEQTSSTACATNCNGFDPSTGEASQREYTSENGSASVVEQRPNLENNFEELRVESTNSRNGSIKLDHAAQIFDTGYEVVIKAELKKKLGVEGTRDQQIEKQIDVGSQEPTRGSPTVCGGTFGSKYL